MGPKKTADMTAPDNKALIARLRIDGKYPSRNPDWPLMMDAADALEAAAAREVESQLSLEETTEQIGGLTTERDGLVVRIARLEAVAAAARNCISDNLDSEGIRTIWYIRSSKHQTNLADALAALEGEAK